MGLEYIGGLGYLPNLDAVEVKITKVDWLTERINRIRLLGREWLADNVKIKKAPPAVGGMREPLVYTKRLKNGDEVRVYPTPEDFNQW